MEQVSLYRKYRPHNFDNLVGQDHIKMTLVNALKLGRVSHAYLFTGPRGTGKTSTARLVAKSLNCLNPGDGYEPCDKCEFCTDISEGRLIDLIEVDAASNRGIDEVRDLKEKINFAPTRAKYKIYIIDEAHMMTKEAFNALLKTLEEPPSHAYFILATTEVHKIPETIISRCQRFDFKRITIRALMTRLSFICQKEEIVAEDEALELISRYVDGGLRDAIGLIEQLVMDGKLTKDYVQDILGITSFSLMEDLFNIIIQKDTSGALKIIHELHNQGSDLRQFMHEFVDLIREMMLQAISDGDNEKMVHYLRLIEIFQKAQSNLQYSSIAELPLEIAVIEATNDFTNFVIESEETKKTEKAEKKEQPKIDNPPKASKEEKEQKAEIQKAEKIEINLETLQENWPRITERIKSPALKLSLRSGLPVAVIGNKVMLEFKTNFHKDKVQEHDYRVELEKVVEEFFGNPIKIETKVEALQIKPVAETTTPENKQKEKNFIDEALEIFGGELME